MRTLWLTILGFCICTVAIMFLRVHRPHSLGIVTIPVQTTQNDYATYQKRRLTLLENCEAMSLPYNRQHVESRLALDHKHRLVYCPVAKVASTFWKRVMQISSGVKKGHRPLDIRHPHDKSLHTISQLPLQDRTWVLDNFTTFLFVREPYSRLLACFIDKFLTPVPGYFMRIGHKITSFSQRKNFERSNPCENVANFPEFIRYVIHTLETYGNVDVHWEPMTKTCGPCEMKYDVIGKLETISTDLDYLVFHYFHEDVEFNNMETESEMDRLESNLALNFFQYKHVKHCMSMREYLVRFLRKQQIRGILPRNINLPEGMGLSENVSFQDFKSFVIKSYEIKDERKTRKANRVEALREAYNSIPIEDMVKLQKLYKADFQIFGYDPVPQVLYSTDARKPIKPFYLKIQNV